MSQKQQYIEQLDDLAELHGVEISTAGTEAELKKRLEEWKAKPLKQAETTGVLRERQGESVMPVRHALPRAAATIQFSDMAGEKHFIVKGDPVDVDEETTAALFDEGVLVDPYAKEDSDE